MQPQVKPLTEAERAAVDQVTTIEIIRGRIELDRRDIMRENLRTRWLKRARMYEEPDEF